MTTRRSGLAVALLATLALLAAGCGAAGERRIDDSAAANPDAAIHAVTTTNFITDTVRRVGGDRVAVTGLMGPGVDPHLYKASAGDVETLSDADVVFYGGLFLEGKMAEVLDEISHGIPSVAVSEAIPERKLFDPPATAAPEEEHDPHVWFDPSAWAYAVKAVRDELIELDPAGARAYGRNASELLGEMKALERDGHAELAKIPRQRRLLVTSHDAFEYFGRAFDLDVHAIQGISTAAEATTSDVDEIASLVADRGVKSVFVESSVPPQTIEAVIEAVRQQGHDVQVGGELFSDAAGELGTREGTYVGMVRANIDTIKEGLK